MTGRQFRSSTRARRRIRRSRTRPSSTPRWMTGAEDHVKPKCARPRTSRSSEKDCQGENRHVRRLGPARTDEEILALKQKWGTTAICWKPRSGSKPSPPTSWIITSRTSCPTGSRRRWFAAPRWRRFTTRRTSTRRQARLAGTSQAGWTGDPHDLPKRTAKYRDDDLCRRLAFLKSVVVVSSEGTNETGGNHPGPQTCPGGECRRELQAKI